MSSRPPELRELYYITHIGNVPSILSRGILSHEQVTAQGIPFVPIYDKEIVEGRKERKVPNGETLWKYANLYFQPRNAMLYRVVREKPPKDVAVIAVKKDILQQTDIFVSDGNAASPLSNIYPASESRKVIPKILKEVNKEYWNEQTGSKRKMMAECLVPNSVHAGYIDTVFVSSHEVADELRSRTQQGIEIIPHPYMFFQPHPDIELTKNLHVVDGDMFFSRMQTLTVSVNIQGVMGKGLASRAKYQFPDVYVRYQDVCRSKSILMGKPYLYKRESSLDYDLADEPNSLKNANSQTWFLLFATKRHWWDMADFEGITRGLQWIRENYQKEDVKGLAIPALGCGLGRLEWKDIGPLICHHLSDLAIPVQVYLPAEKQIPAKYLTKEFLLSGSGTS